MKKGGVKKFKKERKEKVVKKFEEPDEQKTIKISTAKKRRRRRNRVAKASIKNIIEQIDFESLPDEMMLYLLSFELKSADVLSALNSCNYQKFAFLIKRWLALKLINKKMNWLMNDKTLFDLDKIFKKLMKKHPNYLLKVLNKSAKMGHVNFLKLLFKNDFILTDEYCGLIGISSRNMQHEFSKELILNGIFERIENTKLIYAIYLHKPREVKNLIENDMGRAKFSHGSNEIMMAAETGNAEILRLVLGLKEVNEENLPSLNTIKRCISDINAKNNGGMTALNFAVQNGDKRIAKLLIKAGASIEENINDGTPLLSAAYLGFKGLVKFLLKKYSNVDLKDKEGKTALIEAARGGSKKIVNFLLKKGAHIYGRDKEGRSALIYAVSYGHLEIVEFLLKEASQKYGKININGKDNNGRTVLFYAANYGHLEIVEFLFNNGAKIDIHNNDNESPLLVAAANGHKRVVRYLFENNADINERNINNKSPFLAACYGGSKSVAKYLFKKDCDVSAEDMELGLKSAAENGHINLIIFLKKYLKDTKDVDNATLLFHAAGAGRNEVISYLLDNQTDINSIDANGEGATALFYAIRGGKKNTVEFLLENGADPLVRLNNGKTALNYAIDKGHNDIAEILQV